MRDLQGEEVEPVGPDYHQLAVEHAAVGHGTAQVVGHLGEVAGERPLAPALELHVVAVDERRGGSRPTQP